MRAAMLAATLLCAQGMFGFACIQAQPVLDGIEPAVIAAQLERALASTEQETFLAGVMLAGYHNHPLQEAMLAAGYRGAAHRALWQGLLFESCEAESSLSVCAGGKSLEAWVAADDDNLHPALHQMVALVRQSKVAEALQALERGLATGGTNDHYWDRFTLVRRELQAGGFPAAKLNLASEGYAGAIPLYGHYNNVLVTCREQSAPRPVDGGAREARAWAAACLALGRRLEASGNTMFAAVFGAALQRDVLQQIDPASDELRAVLGRKQYYDQIRDTAAQVFAWWTDESLASKPDRFYADALAFGELRAIELALEQAQQP